MRYKSRALFFLFVAICSAATAGQRPLFSATQVRIDPPDWWVDMHDHTLQLCIYGTDISAYLLYSDYPGFNIEYVHKVENPNYLFADVTIDTALIRPGEATITFSDGKRKFTRKYQLKSRDRSSGRIQGIDNRDLVYLIMPDRFANGNSTNDVFEKMNQRDINRDSMFHRHGGDISGVISHLDYIKDLGATAIWLTPVQENDQQFESYHGYAITDHYKIDPRLGDNELYRYYVSQAHARGLKVMMDMVYNHTGSENWFIRDLPMHDWIHHFDTFTKTNYRATALMDPYASDFDRDKMSNGWFAKHMPDLNQQNTYLARYLIQNSLWWIETSGIDGFRFDTYTYSDLTFMSDLMKRIVKEYPGFTAVGELWDHCVPLEAMFMQRPKISGVPDSHLTGLIDFQIYNAINEALHRPMGWTEGLARIYYTLSQDILYSDASKNLTFLDNHDLSRFYSVVGEDIRKYKMGIAFLLTTRGTPQLYYGTEILMKNYADPDGKVRSDFPGGWTGDTIDKFKPEGRTPNENEAFDFVRKLAIYRRENSVLQTGTLTQFVPENDTYVYFRSNEKKTIMIIMHYSDMPHILSLSRYAEKLNGHVFFKDIVNGNQTKIESDMKLNPYEVKVLELIR